MNNFIAVSRILLPLMPALLDAVKEAEVQFPSAGMGPVKLSLVRRILEAVYEVVGQKSVEFDTIWSAAEKIVAFAVSTYNRLGVFKK